MGGGQSAVMIKDEKNVSAKEDKEVDGQARAPSNSLDPLEQEVGKASAASIHGAASATATGAGTATAKTDDNGKKEATQSLSGRPKITLDDLEVGDRIGEGGF